MQYIIVLTIILIIVILVYFLFRRKKKGNNQAVGEAPWIELIRNFKASVPRIKSKVALEDYLASINEEVKKYETDYSFLVAFNGLIKEIREKIERRG